VCNCMCMLREEKNIKQFFGLNSLPLYLLVNVIACSILGIVALVPRDLSFICSVSFLCVTSGYFVALSWILVKINVSVMS